MSCVLNGFKSFGASRCASCATQLELGGGDWKVVFGDVDRFCSQLLETDFLAVATGALASISRGGVMVRSRVILLTRN